MGTLSSEGGKEALEHFDMYAALASCPSFCLTQYFSEMFGSSRQPEPNMPAAEAGPKSPVRATLERMNRQSAAKKARLAQEQDVEAEAGNE